MSTPPPTCRVRALSAPETAYYLRASFGPVRAWSDTLADMIRGRADFHGLTLLPFATVRGRCRRPVYLVSDVLAFVKAARHLGACAPSVKVDLMEIDVPTPAMHPLTSWRNRRAEIAG